MERNKLRPESLADPTDHRCGNNDNDGRLRSSATIATKSLNVLKFKSKI